MENSKSRLKAEEIARGSGKTWAHFPLNLQLLSFYMDFEAYSGSGRFNHHKKADFPFHIVRGKKHQSHERLHTLFSSTC